MNSNVSPLQFLPVLFALLVSVCSARPASEETALANLATAKRAAALKVSERPPGRTEDACGIGVFVSADGLALLPLTDLAYGIPPLIITPDGTELPPGDILGILPEPELAIVKFKHRPKVWLPIAAKEPDAGDLISISGLCHENSWAEKVPPVTGPVMAKRSIIGGNLREPQFRHVLSLGSGLSLQQRLAFLQGSFAINRQGELVAVKAALESADRQKFIFLAPVAGLADRVTAMAKAGKIIPFPLPPASNPIDPVLLDPAFYYWNLAVQRGDPTEAQTHHEDLRKRFPQNVRVNTLPGIATGGAAPLPDIPSPDAKASPAARAQHLRERAVSLAGKGDREGALRELTAALDHCPRDLSDIRIIMGILHLQSGRTSEAETLLREALVTAPESIQVIEILERILTRQDKFDEARKFTDRLYELERVYRVRF